MITLKETPDDEKLIEGILNPSVRKWFFSNFKEFSLPQRFGVMEIHSRKNILVSAPTGATKTLTGFLSILNELLDAAEKGILEDKVYCVYVSPLKALNQDIAVNLLGPLQEIEEISGKSHGIRVAVRTGDTTASERSSMLKRPPHILITTPESLAILLTSIKFSEHLRNVEWCIVDEIHALADNKRGVDLSISLERLGRLSSHMTRVGLSATIAPLEEVASFLVGPGRDCTIVDVQFIKNLDLKVLCPVPNVMEVSYQEMHQKMYQLIHDLVQAHKTTLIFTNTRAATERVVDYLKDKYPKDYAGNIGAHHGSLSKSFRHNIEDGLRQGKLKVVVSSTSLELGIDIGAIDLVLCLGSPKSVARFLQRAGRSGHRLHQTVKARMLVLDRDDLVECAVLLKSALEKKIDRIHIPTNCLDVLAQQIFGIVVQEKIHKEELYALIKKTYCYASLTHKDFQEVLDYLSGKYISLEDRRIYARIWEDEETGMLGRRGMMARVIYMTNAGTIPDESYVTVKVGDQSIGKLDEAFLEKLKKGDVFVLGGAEYEFQYAKGQVAMVTSSVTRPPTIPSWYSEMLPLSYDLALEVGRFRRLVEEKLANARSRDMILSFIHEYLYVDDNAASAIYEYLKEQHDFLEIPHDRKILVEVFQENHQTYYVFHSLFGRRVNDALSRAMAFAISRLQHRDVEIGINDNGFYIGSKKRIQAINALLALKSKQLRKVLGFAVEKTEVMNRRFRHCATRALMILRNYMGRRKGVGRQQVSSMILMNAVRRISPDFCILKEARREVMEDLMDVEHAEEVLKDIESKKIKVKQVDSLSPSPFAFNLIVQGYTDIYKIEARIDFLRRMHQNVLARIALKQDRTKRDS